MNNKKYTNRKVDKISLKKSKKHLWNYLLTQIDMKKSNNSFWSRIWTPKLVMPVSAVAVVLVIAITASIVNFPVPGLKAPTVYASFEMEAEDEDATGIEGDTTFKLEASEDLDEDVIAAVLQVEPAVEFDVEKTGNGKYEVRMREILDGDKIYRFAIRSEDHRYSWAYQVKDRFKVKGTVPGDHGTTVPIESGIEINFSHENYENFEKYFSIQPAVPGRFEYHRRTAVFVPNNALDEATVYTVTIDGDLPLKGSDQTLGGDYVFSFETTYSAGTDLYSGVQFRQPFYEVGVDQAVALRVYSYGEKQETTNVDVYKFSDVDQYIKTWEARRNIPSWCYWSKNLYKYDVEELDYVATFEAENGKVNYSDFIYFPSAELTKGQYLFVIDGTAYNNEALVQITDLSAYISITESESLVWVNDISTGEAVNGATVELHGFDKKYSTNKDGIAVFESPDEWNKSWEDQDEFLLEIKNGGQTLITEISPYGDDSNRDKYWHTFYTDRPMYKGEDTLRYWGFVQPKDNSVKNDEVKILLKKDWSTLIEEYKITVDEKDTFIGEMELGGLLPGYYNLEMEVAGEVIDSRYFEVQNYVKPAYNLTVNTDKKAVFVGEDLEFRVKSQFFEGTPVPNLDLTYSYPDHTDQKAETDKNGEYTINTKATVDDCSNYYCNDSRSFYFDARATLGEETDKTSASTNVRVFRSHVILDVDDSVENDVAKLDFQAYQVDLGKINDDTSNYYYDYRGDVAGKTKIKGKIVEIYWEKTETGEYYDFINKKSVKTYDYSIVETDYDKFEILTNGEGVGTHEFKIDPEKQYRVVLDAFDDDGNNSRAYTTVYGGDSSANNYTYYGLKLDGGRETDYSRVFDIGDEVDVTIIKNEVPLTDETEGKFLFVQYMQGLKSYSIEDSPNYKFEFVDDFVPNMYVGAVIFDGTSYQKTYFSDVFLDTETRKLSIDIETNKEDYEPGQEVTLDIKVEDVDGNGVAAEVNLNLVDEAFYKLVYDFLENPLDDIYRSVSSGVMETYDTHDNPLMSVEEDGGKGGCFVAGTQILMADGSTKNIEDIVAGDYILTKASYTSPRLVAGLVEKTFKEDVSEYIVVNEDLEVTGEHIVFLNGRWQLASKMEVGDVLLEADGGEVKISSLRVIRRPVSVYNFEVRDYHTYFANGFYVHNDKDGGGIRSEFEDVALFKTVSTGSNGRAEVSFTLPDNITSWRVTAKAIDTVNLNAGSSVGAVNVTLPMFADLVMNREFSVKDSPIIKMRAYGDALEAEDEVSFNVGGSWYEKKSAAIEGKAFVPSYYELPSFEKGKHEVTLFAESGKYEDALAKEINVVGSRLTHNVVDIVTEVKDSKKLPVSEDAPTEVVFIDAGRGFFFRDLWRLYYSDGDRLDQRLSQVAAAEMANKYFDLNWGMTRDFEASEYQADVGGLKLFPYADPDLRLSALALFADPDPSRYAEFELKNYFYDIFLNKDSNLDDVVFSLLGLASLDEPVLTSLRVIRQEKSLSLSERLYIALAFEKLGAYDDAMDIYEDIKDELGGTKMAYETGLGAMLGAGLGDKDAILLWDDVDFHGIEDDIVNLYYIGFLDNYFENVSSEKAKFKVKFGDQVADVDLEEEYGTFGVYARPGDTVRVTNLEGDLAAVLYYADEVEPDDFEVDSDVSIGRNYYVDGVATNEFKEGDIVTVRLNVATKSDVASSSYRITDILPSGLTPLTRNYRYYYAFNGSYDYYNYPYYMDGQEVRFYWTTGGNPKFIQYRARVVNPGKFYADPAKIESFYDDTVVNISDGNYVEIEEGV